MRMNRHFSFVRWCIVAAVAIVVLAVAANVLLNSYAAERLLYTLDTITVREVLYPADPSVCGDLRAGGVYATIVLTAKRAANITDKNARCDAIIVCTPLPDRAYTNKISIPCKRDYPCPIEKGEIQLASQFAIPHAALYGIDGLSECYISGTVHYTAFGFLKITQGWTSVPFELDHSETHGGDAGI